MERDWRDEEDGRDCSDNVAVSVVAIVVVLVVVVVVVIVVVVVAGCGRRFLDESLE